MTKIEPPTVPAVNQQNLHAFTRIVDLRSGPSVHIALAASQVGMPTVSELIAKPKSAPPRRPASRLLWRTNSVLRINEQQRKVAKYEAMIQRFQIRRVDDSASTGSKLSSKNIVIDKRFTNTQGNGKMFSLRRLVRKVKKRVAKITPGSALALSRPTPSPSRIAILHDFVMLCAMHFQLFYLPFAPIFYPSGSTTTFHIDLTLELLAIFDIVMTFKTEYTTKRSDPVISKRRIASRYLRGWFFFDVVSALPLQFLRTIMHSKGKWHALCIHSTPLVLIRLIRFLFRGSTNNVSNRLATWIKYSRYTHLVDIVRLLWLVLVIAHYMACSWHLLDINMPRPDQSIADKYIANYFYAVSLIHGQGNISDHWGQNLLATSIILIGSVIVATVFGNVAMLVSNFNANATNYQRKMESVFATVDKMELPDRLRDRIQQYYAHIWAEYKSLDGDLVKFQRELTHTLGLEVGLYKYMSLVNDIPFWIDCSPDFIAQIVLTLVVRVYLPDDYVVRQGEICDEMFMINRGVCEVSKMDESTSEYPSMYGSSSRNTAMQTGDRIIDETKNQAYITSLPNTTRTGYIEDELRRQVGLSNSDDCALEEEVVNVSLHHGQAFGEMSLLMNYGQPSSVRAITFVEMCVLERASFQRIISRYPTDRRRVVKSIIGNCIQKKEIPFAWERLCEDHLHETQSNDQVLESPVSIEMLTPREVVDLLVDKVDVERQDSSILYGFQRGTVEEMRYRESASTRHQTSRAPLQETQRAKESLEANPDPIPIQHTTVESIDHENSHSLCMKMFTMLTELTCAVERLEKSQCKHQQSCCTDEERSHVDRTLSKSDSAHSFLGRELGQLTSNSLLSLSPTSRQLTHKGLNSRSPREYCGSASSSSSGKRWPLSEHPSPYRGILPPMNLVLPHDLRLQKNISQNGLSARSMQTHSTLPMHQEGILSHSEAGNDHEVGRVNVVNTPIAAGLPFHATPSTEPIGVETGYKAPRPDGSLAQPKLSRRASTRHRGSIDTTQSPKPLRLRFLTSRMSNPSSSRGSSWTPHVKRAKTAKEVTLADQLWERQRRRSQEMIIPREMARRERSKAAESTASQA